MYSVRTKLRGDFLQTRVSGAQKSNESDSRLRNLGKVKMAGNFFIVRVFPGSIYKHNSQGGRGHFTYLLEGQIHFALKLSVTCLI